MIIVMTTVRVAPVGPLSGGHQPRGGSLWHRWGMCCRPHSHDTADKVDSAMESSREGMRALWISLAVLGAHRGAAGA